MKIVLVKIAIAMLVAACSIVAVSAKDRDICEVRSDIVAGVVAQRDKGVSRKLTKTAMAKTMPQFPVWLIDLIYDRRDLSAKQIVATDFELCLKEPPVR